MQADLLATPQYWGRDADRRDPIAAGLEPIRLLLGGDGFPSVRPIDTESGDVEEDLALGRSRELHQGAVCPDGVPTRAVHGFGYSAVTVHQCDGLLQVALALIEIRDGPLPEAAFPGIAAPEREDNRKIGRAHV